MQRLMDIPNIMNEKSEIESFSEKWFDLGVVLVRVIL
jgi:hypothetical protein